MNYDYTLNVVAQNNNKSSSKGYTTDGVKKTLEFLDKSINAVPVKNDYNSTDNFIDGENRNRLLQIPEVGNYRLQMIDTAWTAVDSVKGDCIENNSSNSNDGNIKSGCDIISPDINLASYPDHFDVNLTQLNLPNSTHNDFIYMSPIGSSNVAVSYQGTIVAKNADNNTTQNFTTGYFSKDVALDLNTSILSDTGFNTPLLTSDGLTPVNIVRTLEFNHDGDIGIAQDSKLSNLPNINVPANQFTKGSAFIDIRYNIDKNIHKTINPIQVTFYTADATDNNSSSIAHKINNYIPTGDQDLGDTINFYFAKVSPDKPSYPKVNVATDPLVVTPLNVDIFCDEDNAYCEKTGVMDNTDVSGTNREQSGWYLSINHEGEVDGNVTGLTLALDNLTLQPNPSVATPLTLPNGRNGVENATFSDCSHKRVEVTIITDPVLSFQPNSYILNCTNPSEWVGTGHTGHTVQIKPNLNRNEKMSW